MKKTFQNILLLSLLVFCNLLFGQNDLEAVVYLKNHSILRGTIIEEIPNQGIKIQISNGTVFVLQYDEIEKIFKESFPAYNLNPHGKSLDFKKRGYVNLTGFSYCIGIRQAETGNPYRVNSFDIKTVNGYQCNEYFSLGIGVGLDSYMNATLLPITFDMRLALMKRMISPVLNAGLGYALGLHEVKGGPVFNPALGIKIYILKDVSYLFNIGYKRQARENDHASGYYPNKKQNVNFEFITFSHILAF